PSRAAPPSSCALSFLFHAPAPPELSPLSLHDALPISGGALRASAGHRAGAGRCARRCAGRYADAAVRGVAPAAHVAGAMGAPTRSEEHTSELQSLTNLVCRLLLEQKKQHPIRPSTPST